MFPLCIFQVLLLSLAMFSALSVIAYLSLAALTITICFRIYKNILGAVQKSGEGHPFQYVHWVAPYMHSASSYVMHVYYKVHFHLEKVLSIMNTYLHSSHISINSHSRLIYSIYCGCILFEPMVLNYQLLPPGCHNYIATYILHIRVHAHTIIYFENAFIILQAISAM